MDLFNFSMFLKPILMMNGVRDFKIKFDVENRRIQMIGTKYGEKLDISQTFAEIEAAINGLPVQPGSETPAGRHQITDQGEIVDPGRS